MNSIFIVDTNSYAGNFERQMCAYMTGCLGDSMTGQKEAEMFLKKHNVPLENVMKLQGEHGETPVDIFETPNIFNNGVGFHYTKESKEKAINHFKEFYKNEYETQMKRLEMRKNLTNEQKKSETEKLKESLNELEKVKLEEYPAFCSVGIYLEGINDSLIEFLKQRAIEFAEMNSFEITGFRILMRKDDLK